LISSTDAISFLISVLASGLRALLVAQSTILSISTAGSSIGAITALSTGNSVVSLTFILLILAALSV
jgi:hypothetical protein